MQDTLQQNGEILGCFGKLVAEICFRLEQNISRQRPLPQNIQPVYAEVSGQRAGGVRSSQPSCWLLSGTVTVEIMPYYAVLHPTIRFTVIVDL